MTLFSSGADSAKEQWDGAYTTFADARKIFQVDDARHIDDFSSHLRSVISQYANIYLDLPSTRQARTSKANTKSLLKYLTGPSDTDLIRDSLGKIRPKPLAPEVGRLRSIKSESEQKLMRTAADISGRAHAKASSVSAVSVILQLTWDVDNAVHHARIIGRCSGCTLRLPLLSLRSTTSCLCSRCSFWVGISLLILKNTSQASSSPNALIIHYTHNNQIISQDELILIDAGCEYKWVLLCSSTVINVDPDFISGYASDISTKFLLHTSFSPYYCFSRSHLSRQWYFHCTST